MIKNYGTNVIKNYLQQVFKLRIIIIEQYCHTPEG